MRNYPSNLIVDVDIFGDGVIRHLVVTLGVLRRLDEKYGIKLDGVIDRPLYNIVPQAITESVIEQDVKVEDIEDLPISDLERLAIAFFNAISLSMGVKNDPNEPKDQPVKE